MAKIVVSESRWCDRLGRHVYPGTASVSWYYKNPTKRVGLVQTGSCPYLIED
jgi:hypothetical protein